MIDEEPKPHKGTHMNRHLYRSEMVVPCPKCGKGVGERCIHGRSGLVAQAPHGARTKRMLKLN